MTDISKIAGYGKSSLAKAKRERPLIRKLKTEGHLAFIVTPRSADKQRYIVRLAIERMCPLAECVNASTGEPCQGFSRWHHCYHLGQALLRMGA